MNARHKRRLAVAGLLGVGLALLAPPACRSLRGLSLVLRAADFQGLTRQLADLHTVPFQERLAAVPLGSGVIRARVYTPATKPRQTVLLVSGLHAAGIDEPRLMALSRELTKTGVVVVTPEIPELSRFEITPLLTDRIEQAALWLATESGLAPAGQIGLMGVSFSGGLSIVAAGRPALRDRLAYVFALGGHDDLPRVLEYLCSGVLEGLAPTLSTGREISTERRPPHDYGVAVVLLNVVHHLVPADQVVALRDGVRRFLWASYLDGVDKREAEREFAAVRALAPTLPEPSAALLEAVNDRDVARLGPLLLPHLAAYAEPAALSPSRSPAPRAPVFLLHGRDDTVIPATESEHLAERLRRERVPVRLLLTDLISHAEADQPVRPLELFRLASYWGDLLAQ